MDQLEQEWQAKVAATVKAEMARHQVTYKELEARLRAMGLDDPANNEKNLSTKISRGRFSTSFFFQVMQAIGCRVIRLEPNE